MGYVINDDEAKAIKKLIKKFSGTDISFTNGTLRGSFKIISKIKVNKLIKRNLLTEVRSHAAYFGINVRWVENIKKITWL